jgi:hypothetical protein
MMNFNGIGFTFSCFTLVLIAKFFCLELIRFLCVFDIWGDNFIINFTKAYMGENEQFGDPAILKILDQNISNFWTIKNR